MLHLALQAALAPSALRFQLALEQPEAAQRARLRAILSRVRGTRQAAQLGLGRVRGADDFRRAVPLGGPEQLAPLAQAIAGGEPNVLTREAVRRFEPSGGSSGPAKLVPMTSGVLAEFQAALAPWLWDLLASRRALRQGSSYWSISPIGTRGTTTAGGIPVGSAEDSSYFPAPLQPVLDRLFAVPGAVAKLPDVESCRYVTLRCLLAREELAFLSIWNPSFLSLMLDALETHREALARDLERGACTVPPLGSHDAPARRSAIALALSGLRFEARPERARLLRRWSGAPRELWPNMALISMWTDAHAERAAAQLRARLPGVEVQPKGLLATEGVVTIPLFDAPAPVLAVRSHFYEFLEAEAPERPTRLAHELEHGREYEVVLSSSAGLLRYRLGDRVRVEGFVGRTPCLKFLGRADGVCDLVGEKLAPARAGAVLREALARHGLSPAFAMLAPEWSSPPAYHLFIETVAPDASLAALAGSVDARLRENHAYDYARRLGQLGAVTAVRVHDAVRRYEARCTASGQRAGDIKPADLHRSSGWLQHFADPTSERARSGATA